MGLSCVAYGTARLVKAISSEEWDGSDPLITQPNMRFLNNLDIFVDRGDGLIDGIYDVSGAAFHFTCGSYSSYLRFRELLARLSGHTFLEVVEAGDKLKDVPFFEQINFVDDNGFLGPKSCLALCGDYEEYADKAREVFGDDITRYLNWLRACQLAANTGIIVFE